MHYLVGIDDTDNLQSRGTGFHARQLAKRIEESLAGKIEGITRHQLLVDPRIPYTSHNSSACLDVVSDDLPQLAKICREFLLEIAPEGCDIGLCIVQKDIVPAEIVEWGLKAKKEVLNQNGARELAGKYSILLEGLTGTRDGIVGALAAVGLRKSGNDGRFIWLKGKKELRDLLPGIQSKEELQEEFNFESIESPEGNQVKKNQLILLNDWVRPVLKNGKATLLVEPAINERYEWKSATKDYIRANS